MSYSIGEVASRAGFPASTLRYYEAIGLVRPAGRTAAGYRSYDDSSLMRLAFVASAKRLGCSLDEIAGLLPLWEGESCGTVQRLLHTLLTEKIDSAEQQASELGMLAHQLRQAAARLEPDSADGPCDDGCACLVGRDERDEGHHDDAPPIVCTLSSSAQPDRVAEWRALTGIASSRRLRADGSMRLDFADRSALPELARLVAAEQGCCGFLSFAITVDCRGVGLEARAPDEATDVLRLLFDSLH